MKNLRNKLSKIPTLLMLFVAVMMVLPVNVFAILSTDTGTATVTIKGIDEKYDTVTVSAYRIIDTNIDDTKEQPQAPIYTWRDEVVAWVSGHETYKSYIDTNNLNEVTTDFNENLDAKNFYDDLANAIKSGVISLSADATATKTDENADGDIELSGLTMGNYLILIENGMNIYQPSAINIVPEYNKTTKAWEVQDAVIEVKKTTPTIEKTVDTSTASQNKIGETVEYQINVDIPTYPQNAINKQIIISDKFDAGLSLDKTSITVTTDDGATLTAGTDYTIAFDGNDYTFEITFSNDNYESVLRGNSKITVDYNGVINSNALVTTANKNEATLKYSNNPYDTNSYETKKDDVEVYTYGLEIKKVDSDDNTLKLSGAKFSIFETEDCANALKFVKISDGIYRLAILESNENAGITADTSFETELEVSSDGILEIRGLAQGDYWAKETVAPEGYVLLQKPVKMSILDNNTSTELDGIVSDQDRENTTSDGLVEQTIENSDDIITLPVTGGIGTILFSIVGIVLMGLGVFTFKNILRKE